MVRFIGGFCGIFVLAAKSADVVLSAAMDGAG
jgi:hypothetical protein